MYVWCRIWVMVQSVFPSFIIYLKTNYYILILLAVWVLVVFMLSSIIFLYILQSLIFAIVCENSLQNSSVE